MKKFLAGVLALSMAMALAACGSSSTASTETPADTEAVTEAVTAEVVTEEAAAEDPAAGFEETPIWEDEEVAFMSINGVYFQPVPMSGGNENYEDYNLHFEADVSALENDLGYGLGDWIPYLTIDFEIIGSDGTTAAEGTFMPMSASDGPHYGANIKLENADTYSVKLTIHNPEENGYLVHLDGATGPGGTMDEYFGDGPLVVEVEGWDYVPQTW